MKFALNRSLRTLAVAALVLAGVAGCGSGAGTQENPDTSGAGTAPLYSGPAPGSADVQAFKLNLWDNISGSGRCGGCHKAGGQSPMFARSDDVNLAYDAAVQLVDLVQPDQSHLVAKVAGGHNCWLSSPSACSDIMTTWIRNWANAGGTLGGGTQIQLVAPPDKDVGNSKTFPASSALFETTVYDPILHHAVPEYCSGCHSPTAPLPQKPYFASDNVDEAYGEAHSKINLDDPAQSRLVLRLRNESHHCWTPGNCAANAQAMEDAIRAFANGITATQVDPALVISKAVTMYDGTVASGGARIDTNVITRYVFKEGSGLVANDTSGVDPAINLDLSGTVTWVGGWGVSIGAGGKLQGGGVANKKLADRIKATGEYSIEVWAAPANVAQEDAYIVSYSGGTMARNVTLAQRAYQYEAMVRSSETDGNGAPSLLTADADRDAQASLQHVVLTYDPVNGRKLYVNGNPTGDVDPAGGGSLADWSDTFALVLGNETSGDRSWQGVLKFVAIHDRALTVEQIQQNFAAGVGERYYVLFNVTGLTGVPKSYVMFEVTQYDSYSYLFNKPTFISLDSAAAPAEMTLKGMRIGLNGAEARVGQAYIPLDVTIGGSGYQAGQGQLLSSVGTIVGLEKGPEADLFFLTFEQIGTHSHAVSEPGLIAPPPPADADPKPTVGIRTFEELDATMSKITGVSRTTVRTTYNLVRQQMPATAEITSFLSSHQIGIAQLAAAYCGALLDNASLRNSFFGAGFNPATATYASGAQRDQLMDPLMAKVVGTGLTVQPSAVDVKGEMSSLIDSLCAGGTCPTTGSPPKNVTVAKAVCTTALASSVATIQ